MENVQHADTAKLQRRILEALETMAFRYGQRFPESTDVMSEDDMRGACSVRSEIWAVDYDLTPSLRKHLEHQALIAAGLES
jgi:hypothetical protein